MKKIIYLAVAILCISLGYAQTGGVGIGNSIPHNSAALDIDYNNKGLLIPRMSTAQRNSITSPATGLTIYNTDCNNFNYYNGTAWVPLNSIGGLAPATPGSITGSSTVCSNATGQIYSIAAVSGATSYTWTVPAGATVTAGQGSTSVTVTYGTNSGSICVTANSDCGISSPACASINVLTTPAASIATAASSVSNNSFTANWGLVSGATSYRLDVSTVSNFASFVPGYNDLNVGNTSSVSVSSLACNTQYYYRVRAVNTCFTSGNSNTINTTTTIPTGSQFFTYTGADQTFVVPNCVTAITVKLWGGGGGGSGAAGGGGGYSTGTIAVTPGESLTIRVGSGGAFGTIRTSGGQNSGPGGAYGSGNGGAAGTADNAGTGDYNGAAGGGGSGILRSSTILIVAGGGGGGGRTGAGGAGGGASGVTSSGGGGTQSAAGAGGGSGGCQATPGSGGNGGGGANGGSSTCPGASGGGGGGGGYFGGGGGNGANPSSGGGGGGSGYIGGAGVTAASTAAGSGTTPGNSGDADRSTAGQGGSAVTSGNAGRIKITW